jgi:hypothetical protein
MAQKTVRIIAAGSNKELPTVNVVTSGTKEQPTYKQAAKVKAGNNETVQVASPARKGLKTIIVPGYTGPL